MSQPYSQPLRLTAISSGNSSDRSSIVAYEMHLVESTTYGSTIASVGQASMQAVQLPQWSVIGSSYSRSRFSRISPRKTQEPNSFVITFECFPIQPTPARIAQGFSITGEVSTQTFPAAPGISTTIQSRSE